MAKVQKVKWALGANEPDDLAEFLSNEDIVKKHGLPPKGTYTFKIRRLTVKPNKNNDDRIGVMLIMAEPKKSKASKWNGYLVWDGLNVTDQSAPYIKRFLKAMGLTWKDFMEKTKRDDQDPPHIVQIGKVKFESVEDPTVRVLVKQMPADDFNDDDHLEVARYLPLKDEDDEPEDEDEDEGEEESDEEEEDDEEEDEEEEDEEEDEEDDEDEEEEDEEDEEEEDEEDDDEEDEEEEDDEDELEELREELTGLKLAALRKRARRNDKKSDEDFEGMKKADLVQRILEQELNAPPF